MNNAKAYPLSLTETKNSLINNYLFLKSFDIVEIASLKKSSINSNPHGISITGSSMRILTNGYLQHNIWFNALPAIFAVTAVNPNDTSGCL